MLRHLPAPGLLTTPRILIVATCSAVALLLPAVHARARAHRGAGSLVAGLRGTSESRALLQSYDAAANGPAAQMPASGVSGGMLSLMKDRQAVKAAKNAFAADGSTTLVWSDASAPDGGAAAPMVIRTGMASVEVTSVDSTLPRIRLLAAQVGGYVANSSVQGGHDQVRTATLEIKAPAESYDRLVAALSPLGTVESVNVTAEDVGEEYVDVDARLANDRRLDERLVQLLAERTGKLKDVLDVERELARVREEMERYQGRLRYLRAHAAVSSLSITIHEPVPIIRHPGPNPLVAAARQAWQNFMALVAMAVASLGVVVPVAVGAALLWWGLRRRGGNRPAAETP